MRNQLQTDQAVTDSDHPEEVLQFVLLIPEDRKYDYYDDFIRILESVKEK